MEVTDTVAILESPYGALSIKRTATTSVTECEPPLHYFDVDSELRIAVRCRCGKKFRSQMQ